MLKRITLVSIAASAMIASVSMAQTPASAPAGSTGMCRDGSYWTGATKKGACRGHKGVQDWYGAADAAGGASSTSAAAPATPAPAPAPAAAAPAPAAAAPAAASTAAPHTSPPANTAAAPGGGADKVWVNTSSKVYHCPADRWYGKTKSGTYMTEAQAIAQGNHADHGKACKQ